MGLVKLMRTAVAGVLVVAVAICGVLFWPAATCAWYRGYVPNTVLPQNLLWLLGTKGPRQVRTLGRTQLGDPAVYDKVELTEADRTFYHENGYLLLKGAMKREIVTALRDMLTKELGVGIITGTWDQYLYMDSDALLDFYLYGPMGKIAAQLIHGIKSPPKDAETLLWSDFANFIAPGEIYAPFHYDGQECNGMQPANRSKIRFWITLDDDVPAPPFVNQTTWADILEPHERVQYFNGESTRWQIEEVEKMFGISCGPDVAPGYCLQSVKYWNDINQAERMSLRGLNRGDMLVFNPCLFHTSPKREGDRILGFACPTYSHPDDPVHLLQEEKLNSAPWRFCNSGLKLGDSVVGNNCYQKAYPEEARPARGSQLKFEHQMPPGGQLEWYRFHILNWIEKGRRRCEWTKPFSLVVGDED
eukprot:gnl/TRDRNA2_/TRDRNA2_135618_c0_seq2.p1 gnl/TRDRNA2_/TRDRNA2_135618_c0~~gnl/TRDRNA2_/TRDRNA2_135618_c0_seq2.p1  ORF type:complete len:417 (+),score=60.61 gnl/TRDRNA2_/TRDRNA2_135618_c0_seq2:104-1354(+)